MTGTTMKRALIAAILAGALGLLSFSPVYADKNPGLPPDSISLDANTRPVAVRQRFTVSILTDVATPAYGFGFQLEYDPDHLDIVPRRDPDAVRVPAPVGLLFREAQRVKNAPVPVGDRVQIDAVYTFLPPSPAVRGTGAIATITFEVIEKGTTEIRLLNPRLIELRDGVARDIPVTVVDSRLAFEISRGNEGAGPAGPAEPDLAAPASSVHLAANASAAAVDRTFAVDIRGSLETSTRGFELQLGYDPRFLEIVPLPDSADAATVPAPVGDLFLDAQRIENVAQPLGDGMQIRAAYTLPSSLPAAQGAGTIATVAFRVLQGGSTQIELLSANGIDSNDRDVPFTIRDPVLNLEIPREGGEPVADVPAEPSPAETGPALPAWAIALIAMFGVIIVLLSIVAVQLAHRRGKARRKS